MPSTSPSPLDKGVSEWSGYLFKTSWKQRQHPPLMKGKWLGIRQYRVWFTPKKHWKSLWKSLCHPEMLMTKYPLGTTLRWFRTRVEDSGLTHVHMSSPLHRSTDVGETYLAYWPSWLAALAELERTRSHFRGGYAANANQTQSASLWIASNSQLPELMVRSSRADNPIRWIISKSFSIWLVEWIKWFVSASADLPS